MSYHWQPKVIDLTIPKGTVVFVSNEHKCRAEQVISHGEGISYWDGAFTYVPGEVYQPIGGFSMKPEPCASGIHFFTTKKRAERYRL